MTDTYLLDTNMVGILADRRPDIEVNDTTRRFRVNLEKAKDAKLAICVVTIGEIGYGLKTAPPKFSQEKKEEVRRIIRSFHVICDIESTTAVPCYAEARAKLFERYGERDARRGRAKIKDIEALLDIDGAKPLGIQENDLWIASVALQYNLVLVTNDKMFRIKEVCPDLRIEDWSQ